ncbi:hypothetical protein GCM10007906_23660 [Vibrio hyugaensis]|uniref:Uncharacterized protein n=1 Tax=Vibrio hyugaensis TaxID=1534743 RepID=A0ABQ5Y2X1_9VIBR|nr:hypothetical protein GCM10007906_23660 [Vibrio hyugaensis]
MRGDFDYIYVSESREGGRTEFWLSLRKPLMRSGKHLAMMFTVVFGNEVELMSNSGKVPSDQQRNTEQYNSAMPMMCNCLPTTVHLKARNDT